MTPINPNPASSTGITWYGSQQESLDLVNAVARNCTCEFGQMGVRLSVCAPLRMLVEDQRALNGLLFARRMVDRLRREEWNPGADDAQSMPMGGMTGVVEHDHARPFDARD